MNLNFINKEFDRLNTLQECIDYQFEPKSKNIGGKRNIYYEDLKHDFVNEVNTFGFSPFILENFEKQRKNPNVMKHMNKKFNHGLTNYVRKQNQQVKYKEQVRLLQEKKKKENLNKQQSSLHLKRKEAVKTTKKETFLRKALENLAHNKLNISNEEDLLFEENKDDEISNDNLNNKNEKTEDMQKRLVEANKKKIVEQLREKYFQSIRDQPDSLPKITIAEFEKPSALKVNFENLFVKKNKKGQENEKKIVALSKNKEYLFTGITNQNIPNDGYNNGNNEGGLKSLSPKMPMQKSSKKKKVKFWKTGGKTFSKSNYNINTITNFMYTNTFNAKNQTISSSCSNKERYMLFVRAKRYKDINDAEKEMNTIQTE